MIQRGKKLCNIKCNDAGVALLESPCSNEMCKVYTSINSRPLPNVSKLIGIQETIGGHLKLKPVANDFFDEFACGIK